MYLDVCPAKRETEVDVKMIAVVLRCGYTKVCSVIKHGLTVCMGRLLGSQG